MKDVINSKYAEWLEELIRIILENEPDKIGVVFTTPEDLTFTYYYGECLPPDKALMSYWINSDATMDTIIANSKMIIESAEQEEDEDYEEDDE